MTSRHPDIEVEQAYIDVAYENLETARERAALAVSAFRVGRGGTEQARFELEAMLDGALMRLTRLDIGDRSLVFGRIDLSGGGERFYIGRVGLWDAESNPLVVDWRAPVSEPFYRATGREPLGLEHRRRFMCRGRRVLGIEDEYFGHQARIGFDISDRSAPSAGGGTHGAHEHHPGSSEGHAAAPDSGPDAALGAQESSRVLADALDAPRTGRLSDIVATIQAEQDEVIRADMPGVLVVQGGPGTGKTVVALHRASYLLYTHRFPLESQGVLVVAPNRLFLAYIEQVLPALGEAGVELGILADLLRPAVRVGLLESEDVGRAKGDARMSAVLRRAVRDRQRPLRAPLEVGYGLQRLRLDVEQSEHIVTEARRRHRRHNAARRWVEREFYEALAQSGRRNTDPDELKQTISGDLAVREALEWMWPVLSPGHLLNDLLGSRALLRSAAASVLPAEWLEVLYRPRHDNPAGATWSFQDVALLDEARALLGFRPGHREEDTVSTFGHIVVDEAQDLSPMQLRMLERRSLGGSMTIVGDIAQATGPWAHDDWDSVLAGLPSRRPARRRELTIGYRIPEAAMTLANRVLPHAAPGAKPPVAMRAGGDSPRIVRCSPGDDSTPGPGSADLVESGGMVATLAEVIHTERHSVGEGNVAVVVPQSLASQLHTGLAERGLELGGSGRDGLNKQITLVPVRLVKGLEVDAVIVVEPARIVREERRGVRSLYVALTRATRRVTVVHAEELPGFLATPTGTAG